AGRASHVMASARSSGTENACPTCGQRRALTTGQHQHQLAYRLARANRGAPGGRDNVRDDRGAAGLETWLSDLRMDLAAKTYKAAPVRKVMIPKPGGGERPLGIPAIRDRVVQTAAKLVLEPIFE